MAEKNFPRDKQFHEQFVTLPPYGGGDRRDKAKLILDRLEASYEHKESITTADLTIEHVMPQTPTEWWKEQLGDDWASTHEYWLNTVGNLTLTGYNPELSNFDYPKKKAILQKSHVELNRCFNDVDTWDEAAIASRGEVLAERALAIWPDFAPRAVEGEIEVIAEKLYEKSKFRKLRLNPYFGGFMPGANKLVDQSCIDPSESLVRKSYTSDLTDDQWSLLAPFLPPNTGRGRPQTISLREAGSTHLNRLENRRSLKAMASISWIFEAETEPDPQNL